MVVGEIVLQHVGSVLTHWLNPSRLLIPLILLTLPDKLGYHWGVFETSGESWYTCFLNWGIDDGVDGCIAPKFYFQYEKKWFEWFFFFGIRQPSALCQTSGITPLSSHQVPKRGWVNFVGNFARSRGRPWQHPSLTSRWVPFHQSIYRIEKVFSSLGIFR